MLKDYFNNKGKQPAGMGGKKAQKAPKQVFSGKQKSQVKDLKKYPMGVSKKLKNKGTAIKKVV